MKNILLISSLIIFECSGSVAQAPDWLWAKSIGGTGDDFGRSLACDAFGNVYTTGYFNGIVDFDPGAGVFNLTSAGGYDIFISKLDSSGNFVWAKAIGGTSEDDGYSIAIDPTGSGNVYTTGIFQGTVDFDPDTGVFNLIAAGYNDIFISKLDNSGNFVWAKGMGGSSDDWGFSIKVDPVGNVYSTGTFFGTADFDPGIGTFYLPSATSDDIFISKLDSSGNFLWAKAIGGGGNDYCWSIALDPAGNGNVYTTGYFYGTVDFDPGAGVFNLTSGEIFISKLDSSGNFVWAKSMGGTGLGDGYAIAIDPAGSGEVYTTGRFYGTVDFNPDSSANFTLTSAGGYDIFISKLDGSGNFLWAKAMGGAPLYDIGWSIAVDPAGSGAVYTTGRFEGTADFDPGAGVFNLTSAGDLDIFISKLDSSGNFVWAKAMGGIDSDGGSSIAIDPAGSGAVYITGYFEGTVDFDPGAGVFNLTSVGSDDIFICKLDNSGNFVWAIQMGGTDYDEGFYIVIDTAGSGAVYTTGYFDVTADFDPGAGVFNLTAVGMPGLADIFISKLDSSGNFVWAKAMGGISSDFGYSIALDPAGSGALYTTGEFKGTTDFDPGAGVFNLISAGIGDIYISKLDSSGNFVWAKAMGGTNWDASFSITIDPAGSGALYTTGLFRGTADFDPGAGVFNLTSAGLADIFISKLDISGNFVWAKAMGGTNDDYSTSIAIDPAGSGDVYTTGMFEGTADFDPGAGIFNLTSAGGWDIFISKLDTSGNCVWAKATGGTSDDIGNSIKLGASGHVHVTGSFDSPTISFGSTTLINADNTGSTLDIFIARLDTMGTISGINEIGNSHKDILLSPNPLSNSTTISFSLSQSQKISLRIFDVNGRLVSTLTNKMFEAGENEIVWNAADVNAGIYFLRMETATYSENRKLIVAK